ncbi:MAG: hypothetical protein HC848_03410 [Limnobacter sp.]|nr:hypothetical protein [Limnobacter sp.]
MRIGRSVSPVTAKTAAGVDVAAGERLFDLLEHVFRAEPGRALEVFSVLHRDGADPVQVLADLAVTDKAAFKAVVEQVRAVQS